MRRRFLCRGLGHKTTAGRWCGRWAKRRSLASEPRQKVLLWNSTYKVSFGGDYQFHNPENEKEAVKISPAPEKYSFGEDVNPVQNQGLMAARLEFPESRLQRSDPR
jgi:hypothetical protein